ncbi:MAG: hypothetical protein D3924_16965 [Candidatus Electrothrix sp. AR4]|nr:hypothetical protein [Candidatus Electrothrix sp. AR4]
MSNIIQRAFMNGVRVNIKINKRILLESTVFLLPVYLLFFVAVGLLVPQSASAASCLPPFSRLIQKGGYGVSNAQGGILSACNLDIPYVPASLFKIPTALAALTILGPEYRFKTRFYMDSEENLYIEGFGDPLLISEEIILVFDALKKQV